MYAFDFSFWCANERRISLLNNCRMKDHFQNYTCIARSNIFFRNRSWVCQTERVGDKKGQEEAKPTRSSHWNERDAGRSTVSPRRTLEKKHVSALRVGLAAFSRRDGEITEGKSVLKLGIALGAAQGRSRCCGQVLSRGRSARMAVDGDGARSFEAATFLPESPSVFAFEGSWASRRTLLHGDTSLLLFKRFSFPFI